jgi:hypothetical protein
VLLPHKIGNFHSNFELRPVNLMTTNFISLNSIIYFHLLNLIIGTMGQLSRIMIQIHTVYTSCNCCSIDDPVNSAYPSPSLEAFGLRSL